MSFKKTLGICSSHTIENLSNKREFNYETNSLVKEGKKIFDEVFLINPLDITYKFEKKSKKPVIRYRGKDISSLSCLIVRGTSGCENAIATFCHALDICGCYLVDPIERFSGASPSKLLTTIERFKKGIGIDSYYSFTYQNTFEMIEDIYNDKKTKLIAKPIDGSRGFGIELLETKEEALDYAEKYFNNIISSNQPIFFQKYEVIKKEYRIIILDSKSFGIVEKIPKDNSIVANYAQGATFINTNNDEITNFVINSIGKEGLFGVDVAKTIDNELFIIEANRAPQWRHFDEVTKKNIAREVLEYAINRI